MSLSISFYCSNPNFQDKNYGVYPFLSCHFPSSKINSFSHLSVQDRTLLHDSTVVIQIMYCLNIFPRRTTFLILLPKSRLVKSSAENASSAELATVMTQTFTAIYFLVISIYSRKKYSFAPCY